MNVQHTDPVAVEPKQSGDRRLWPSFTGLGIAWLLVPLFYFPLGDHSYWTSEGTLMAAMAAAVSCYGFFSCPRRPLGSKVFTSVVFALTLLQTIVCVVTYILYRGRDR